MQDIPLGPPDKLFGLIDAFNKDSSPNKISLSIGAYRDDDGNPFVLPSVRKAERIILEKEMNHEYAGIAGVPGFLDTSFEFAYGKDCKPLQEGRVGGVQAISGTGGLRIAGELLKRFRGAGSAIYLPAPTWGNHIPIMRDAGLEVKEYTYYDPATCGLNFNGMMDDMKVPALRRVVCDLAQEC